MAAKTIQRSMRSIKYGKIEWIDICRPTRENMEMLKNEYNFHDLDVDDCLSPGHVAKVDAYKNYIFMVLLLPVYKKSDREIIASEVDFFIKKNLLVTVHKREIHTLDNFFKEVANDELIQKRLFHRNIAQLLHHVLEKMLFYTFPMLEHIHTDIKALEKRIFSGYERDVVRDLLVLKRNIINFRKAMQFHKGMIRRLITKSDEYFSLGKQRIYFQNLIEHTKDIWDTLEIQKENIDALQDTNESLISFRLNDIMKFLTIISVIMLPGALVAGIFGMNAIHMPVIGNRYDFWIVLGIMAIISLTMIFVFKRKRWL